MFSYKLLIFIQILFVAGIVYSESITKPEIQSMQLVDITPCREVEYRNKHVSCGIDSVFLIESTMKKGQWGDGVSLQITMKSTVFSEVTIGGTIQKFDIVKLNKQKSIKIIPADNEFEMKIISSDNPLLEISYADMFLQIVTFGFMPVNTDDLYYTVDVLIYTYPIPMAYNNKLIQLDPSKYGIEIARIKLKRKGGK